MASGCTQRWNFANWSIFGCSTPLSVLDQSEASISVSCLLIVHKNRTRFVALPVHISTFDFHVASGGKGVGEGLTYRPVTLDWIELQRWLRPFWNWHVQAYMVVHVAAPLHPRNPPTPPQPQTKQRKPLGQTRFARLPSWLAGDK